MGTYVWRANPRRHASTHQHCALCCVWSLVSCVVVVVVVVVVDVAIVVVGVIVVVVVDDDDDDDEVEFICRVC